MPDYKEAIEALEKEMKEKENKKEGVPFVEKDVE